MLAGLSRNEHHLRDGVLRPGALDAQPEGVADAPVDQSAQSAIRRQWQQWQRHPADAGAAGQVLGAGALHPAGERA